MFLYDLELPAGVIPRNTDGEIAEFMLMDVDAVADEVRAGRAFKFNVTLVLIDFLIRHGRLSPENQPDYLDLLRGFARAASVGSGGGRAAAPASKRGGRLRLPLEEADDCSLMP